MDGSAIDCFLITESWLTPRNKDNHIAIPQYNLTRVDREVLKPNGKRKRGGGLLMYIHQDLVFSDFRVNNFNISDKDIELQCIEVNKANSKRIIIINLYRPPNGHLNSFLEIFSEVVTEIKKPHDRELFILGDFNIDM